MSLPESILQRPPSAASTLMYSKKLKYLRSCSIATHNVTTIFDAALLLLLLLLFTNLLALFLCRQCMADPEMSVREDDGDLGAELPAGPGAELNTAP